MEMESDDFGELYPDFHHPISPPQPQPQVSTLRVLSSDEEEGDDRGTVVSDKVGFDDLVQPQCGDDGDSDDDGLRIILNDYDCPLQSKSSGADDNCDFVIVGGGDRSTKESKRTAGLSLDGFQQQIPHLSQFKYVRPHSTISGSSSMPCARGYWDSSGAAPPLISCSSAAVYPVNHKISVSPWNKPEFYLPRNRTIFEVDIGKFDQKPWMNNGVDKSNFFNFELDEESWKNYCADLKVLYQEQHRQQFPVKMGVHVHNSSPTIRKVLGNVIHHEFHSDECAPAEFSLPSLESGEVVQSILEMPKGRAIQVEGCMIERTPSMALKNAKYRDADVIIQIPLQDTVDTARPDLNLILEKSPSNCEKKEFDMSDEHSREHQDNASAVDSGSSLTRNSKAKSSCSPVSQKEEIHANCSEPSADKVSVGEENGSNSLAKESESPHMHQDAQSFSSQFDDDEDYFEDSDSENGASLETLDSSYNSRNDREDLEKGGCSSHQEQLCSSGLARQAEDDGVSPANFNLNCHTEDHAAIDHRACTSKQPLSSKDYKRGGSSCFGDKKVGASILGKRDSRQEFQRTCFTSSIKSNVDRNARSNHFDSRHYNLEKQLPMKKWRGRAELTFNSRHIDQGVSGLSFSNFCREERRHRYTIEKEEKGPIFRYQREKWLDWEDDIIYYKRELHENRRSYFIEPEISRDRYRRHVPGIDSRHEKFTKCQNHDSGFRKTKRQCFDALPLSDLACRSSEGYDDHDLYRVHSDEWGPYHNLHGEWRLSDEEDWIHSSGKMHSYPLSRFRSPCSDEDEWGDFAGEDRRIDNNLYYENHHSFIDEYAIPYRSRGSNCPRSLGRIYEHGRQHRNDIATHRCSDLNVEMHDGTRKLRNSVHLSFVGRKFQPRGMTEDEDISRHRHRYLSRASISSHCNKFPGRRGALRYNPKVGNNQCSRAFAGVDGVLKPKVSAETNAQKVFKKVSVVGNQKVSSFRARNTSVTQNQWRPVLPEKKPKMSEVSPTVKQQCSSELLDSTLNSLDVPTSEKAKTVKKYEHKRIIATLEKMERRKERFREFTASEKELLESSKHQSEAPIEADELKLQRPLRKRRWGD